MAQGRSTSRIYRALGGNKILKEQGGRYGTLIDHVRGGLPYAAVDAVAERFEIPKEDLLRILHLPLRTLARRKKEGVLRPDESDRLLRLGRITSLTEEVLGTREKAAGWLKDPNRALGGSRPLDRLDTDLGVQEVEQILGRIAHGVYS